ncbi:UDP-N-acetylmuramate--L-alanine ligase [Aureibacter tunicatorum]|uniref:UDP-N-acetylmuramate--L-alanine ligase n=1 Tax=Aureibacter tunicatorum TaxID=866807 RepID=A0AAE4BTZ1_9BACT|nr:UDP-N-acetylmuramate--L-alanine ligase [Aureibacter tunicatorum]MDR6241241.1 UDP-N-acetylmuramate--alanine ligase [Aureibacter tunicatorum]BDD03501.1 UDP-N-acetylmuramate--L-alanine ligase [Aureibacter tunicatorum]
MNLKEIKYVYFLGIGGIGMSALARWFNHHGKEVSGYDRSESDITKSLISEGIKIFYKETIESIPDNVIKCKESTLVVYTPAISGSNVVRLFFENQGYKILKRAEVLGAITASMKTLAVAGTHGKTTTSTMLTFLLDRSGVNCSAFLGGISSNYNSNLLLGDADKELLAVVEADEFDRSFLRLSPDQAIITSIEADHLDIYGDDEEVVKAFVDFTNKFNDGAIVYVSSKLPSHLLSQLNPKLEYRKYGLNGGVASFRAENLRVKEGYCVFDYVSPIAKLENCELLVPGDHNVENMVAAISLALENGASSDLVRQAVKEFKGVKRRFEYHIKSDSRTFIDDYAHHPTEVRAIISSLKEMYPQKKLTVVFQPHLYSRTKDFADEFARSLDLADDVLVTEIYPARELPIEGVTSELITNVMNNDRVKRIQKNSLLEEIRDLNPELLLTIGAGDIANELESIKKILK